jgi:hypothetical protein
MPLCVRTTKKVTCCNQAASINEKGCNCSEVGGVRRETTAVPMSHVFGFGSFTGDRGSSWSCHGPHQAREDFLVLLHSWTRKVHAQSCGAVDAASSLGQGAQLGSPSSTLSMCAWTDSGNKMVMDASTGMSNMSTKRFPKTLEEAKVLKERDTNINVLQGTWVKEMSVFYFQVPGGRLCLMTVFNLVLIGQA